MADEPKNLPMAGDRPTDVVRRSRSDLLQSLLSELPEDERRELAKTIAREAQELESQANQDELLHVNTAINFRHIANNEKSLNSLVNADRKSTYEGKLPTGKWRIEITKNSNLVIIVIAIVFGIVAVLVLTK